MAGKEKAPDLAEAPDVEEAPEPVVYVMFTERPGIRLISASDWEKAGVKDHVDTRWGPENDWTIAKADLDLNEEQFARIITADRYFRLQVG